MSEPAPDEALPADDPPLVAPKVATEEPDMDPPVVDDPMADPPPPPVSEVDEERKHLEDERERIERYAAEPSVGRH